MSKEKTEVSLTYFLTTIPKDAQLLVEHDEGPIGATRMPVGLWCHEAAEKIGGLARALNEDWLNWQNQAQAMEQELEDYHRLTMMQGELLTGAVNAIRGEPEDLSSWSHDDIVELVTAQKSRVETLEQRVQELEKQNALINAEYKKTWDVLRTYNPQDIELEYIGFETVEVKTSTD